VEIFLQIAFQIMQLTGGSLIQHRHYFLFLNLTWGSVAQTNRLSIETDRQTINIEQQNDYTLQLKDMNVL